MTKKTAKSPEEVITFKFLPSQARLFHKVTRGAGTYIVLKAPQCLEVGGQRSGKTTGKLMHGILEYCLRYRFCDMLVLRRTVSELDNIIQDVYKYIPETMFTYVGSPVRTVTFHNGSRIVFGGCANDVERDIEKYLGQAYPYIQVSECAQFSPEVWNRLAMRNLVNNRCEPDEFGNKPIPRIVGDTNPIGAHFDFYRTIFYDKKPWDAPEGTKQDKEGRYWSFESGEWRCIYDPQEYAINQTTILDNPEYMKTDPGMVQRLNQMPKAMREIFLLGKLDGVSGQYFDCWSNDYVIDLREDPEAIIWQPYQPVIGGQDWGAGSGGHANAFYLLTRALVRSNITGEYRPKIVCFRELWSNRGLTSTQFADLIKTGARYPNLPETHPQYHEISGQPCKIAAIFFSHEKFNRVMEQHSPADEYSKLLRERGLPPVSRASTDRIGSAGYMYDQMKKGNIAILKTCPEIIQAIPSLQRDPKRLDDVLKTSAKADDLYDSFRYALYGMYKEREMPQEAKDRIEVEKLQKENPFAAHFARLKKAFEAKERKETFVQKNIPMWQTKL